MKLVFMVVESSDADPLSEELVHAGHTVTKLGSSGGFVRRRSYTLFTGVADEAVEEVITIARRVTSEREEFAPIRQLPFLGEIDLTSEPKTVRGGGAVIWVIPVERFEQL